MIAYFNYRKTFFFAFFFFCAIGSSYGQWDGAYGNEWLNYDQDYLKIKVERKGVHRILLSSLPASFRSADPKYIQLWHRGKEVSIIESNSTEIVFYAESNDGASDSLVFRPAQARLNPYISLFSDLGYYFLTVSKSMGKRVEKYSQTTLTGAPDLFHLKKIVYKFNNQFAFSTFAIGNSLNNSFYENGNSWTGESIAGPKSASGSVKMTEVIKELSLDKLLLVDEYLPEVEVLIHGLHEGAHDVQISVGKSSSNESLRKVGSLAFTGWGGRKLVFKLTARDIDESGKVYLKLNSISESTQDWFSLTYCSITYPQEIDMKESRLAYYDLAMTDKSFSRVKVSNASVDAIIYDITDTKNLRVLPIGSGSDIEFMVPRVKGKQSNILAVHPSEILNISASNITNLDIDPIFSWQPSKGPLDPSEYDYLIVTSSKLKDGAIEYARYRSSTEGGGYRVLVVDIQSIYSLFNFGEPSPLAIRRFCKFMLSKGVRDKHNLLLMGVSVTIPVNLAKEMDQEVPTFGDPGSDVLLVAGLTGTNPDLPAIPVGRINAISNQDISNYLNKVKVYEHQEDLGWRKNVLHLNGGHSAQEISQLKNILEGLKPIVTNGEMGANLKAYVKKQPVETTELVDISEDVNNGVGLITYFGHGSQNITDLDIGLVSDDRRGYKDSQKYSLMYFNGCGVGNIFTSRSRHVLSGDWLVSPRRGAIAVIANSYNSYVSTSANHLNVLYNTMFGSTNDLTIGQVLKEVSSKILANSTNSYDVANVHQSNLLGDPALYLVKVSKPDYAIEGGIFIKSQDANTTIGNSDNIQIGVTLKNYGKYLKNEIIPTTIKYSYQDGTSITQNLDVKSVALIDTFYNYVVNKVNLTKIEVTLDPADLLNELRKDNNLGSLAVDWDIAKNETFYSAAGLTDLIPPILSVKMGGKELINGGAVKSDTPLMLTLQDNFPLEADTSLVEVYFRRIDDSGYNKLLYSSEQIKVNLMNPREMEIKLVPGFRDGIYELRIDCKDVAGNKLVRAYMVDISVEMKNVPTLLVSPNPASDYVHFALEHGDDGVLSTKVKLLIFDQKGTVVLDNDITNTNGSGFLDWYWYPKVKSGTYLYKIITEREGDAREIKGKVILVR